ncbi:MAG: CHAT domain-containing protein [Candidatus Eisenbacteria bacterium]|nr:CHAT domain-containing protein [Candidatus Eisenbacteria bacterium]
MPRMSPSTRTTATSIDFRTAETGEIESVLQQPGWELDPASAAAVRDRAAALVLADPSRAFSLSTALLDAGLRSTEPAVRMHAWRCRAEACLYSGRVEASGDAYASACAEAERARDRSTLGQILVGRVHALALAGRGRESARLAARTERLLTRNRDRVYLAKLHSNRGNALYQQESFAAAATAYARAARMFRTLGVKDQNWFVLRMNQGIAATSLGQLEQAHRFFVEIEREAMEAGLDYAVAHAQYNRAFIERARGDHRRALRLLTVSGAAFAPLGALDLVAAADRARAEIYLELGMAAEAEELSESAAARFSAEGMELDAVLARHAGARALLLSGQFDRAHEVLAGAVQFYRAQRMPAREAVAVLDQARGYFGSGDLAASDRLGRRSARLFERLGLDRWSMQARVLAVELVLEQIRRSAVAASRRSTRLAKAANLLAPILARSTRLPLGERQRLFALAGRIARLAGDPGGAARHLRRAVDLLEAERRLIPGVDLRAGAFARRVSVFHDLIALELDRATPRVERVFAWADAARARGFRERAAGLGPSHRLSLERMRGQLGSATRQLEEAEFEGRAVAQIRELERRTRLLERELTQRLLHEQSNDDRVSAFEGSAGLGAVRRALAAGDALVSYFVSSSVVLAIVARRRAVELVLLPTDAAEIREQIDRVRFQFDAQALDRDTEQAGAPPTNLAFSRRSCDAALRRVFDALLAPLLPALGSAHRLLIVPHDFLHLAPFECLHDGADYIDQRFSITRLPTADFVLRKRRARGGPSRAVVAGMIASGPGFVEAELRAVERLLSRGSESRPVSVLRDPTSEELRTTLDGAGLLHLSTHGVFREDNPAFSRLSLRDGALFLADLHDHRLAAELVVLSACNSGRVFADSGDDLAGVAHGFLAAGARQLVASLWRVHDAATRELMEAFYRAYVEGTESGDAARALRAAQAEVRTRWNHPFYWGAFSTHGV